ncbi:MAG: TIGR00730 family Rossman fold protein [Proteobacteria bacterium]|nr:TIGR00730 family Rossman fold protein [Pseudomonadota bacterium]
MRSLCVFCGAAFGTRPVYIEAAEALGRYLAVHEIEVVWGGGQVGLMGALADAAIAGGGRAYGVIPRFMVRRELAHSAATTMVTVDSMHERKAAMVARADGFVALPGGFGTLDELFEVITWAQLHIHAKPIGLLNVEGFFDPLLTMMRHLVAEGFVLRAHVDMLHVASTPEALLAAMRGHRALDGDWAGKVARTRPVSGGG